MRLVDVLGACGRMEKRAAALYRRFACEVRADSPYASLWNDMAREEDGHAAAVREAEWDLPANRGWRVSLEGWTEAMQEMVESLQRAERLPPTASDDERLVAAFDIELGEMDALRNVVIEAVERHAPRDDDDHLTRLADVAVAHSSDPRVLALATIARARRRLTTAR